MPKHGPTDLIWGPREAKPLPRLCAPGSDLLDHSANPRTDLGIEAATRPQLARDQSPPVLYRMWLGALDPPAGLRGLIKKYVISPNFLDEHPLGADLISHAANASSVRAALLRSSSPVTGQVARGSSRRAGQLTGPENSAQGERGARCSLVVRLHLDSIFVNIDACRIKRPWRSTRVASRRPCCVSH